jgi:putative Holliday junction resolvase
LAIDFGEARIGLAVSDPLGRLALPLTTLVRHSDQQVIAKLQDLVEAEGIEHLILGEPRNLDGSRGAAVERVRSFRRKLSERIPLPCDLVDESLTSVEAVERLRAAGADLRRQPERIDAVAAQILLEQFLDQQPTESRDG